MKNILWLIIPLTFLFNDYAHANFIADNHKHSFEVGGEWLYWKAEESQLELGANVSISGTERNSVIDGKVVRPNFKYSSGYRIWADYQIAPCWDIGFALTHLDSRPNISISLPPGDLSTRFVNLNAILFPVFQAFANSNAFSSFDSQLNLNLYYYDFFCTRKTTFCNCIDIEPYLAVRGFWMKQDLDIAAGAPERLSGPLFVTANFNERFVGAGLAGAVSAAWNVGCGFSLVGELGGALVYSKIRNHLDTTGILFDPGVGLIQTEIINRTTTHKSHPMIDTFIGLQYEHAFCNCGFEIHVGWENHLFFHTNNLTITSDGNLTTQGLTLGGSVFF